jgi:hypothetical protein
MFLVEHMDQSKSGFVTSSFSRRCTGLDVNRDGFRMVLGERKQEFDYAVLKTSSTLM